MIVRFCMVLVCLSPAFAQTEKKLDANIFGEIKARNIGPAVMSGRITDIAVPVGDPKTVYLGTGGGGVWKSSDGGMNFSSIFDDHIQSIGCVTVDPSDPKTVWVGTGEINTRNSVSYGDGLYRSKNGGQSWEHMGFSDSERIGEIVVHPTDSKIVYVAVLGHLWSDNEERGLYKTIDGGKTWDRILQADKTGCIDIDLDPQQPDIVYAAMWQVRRWPWTFTSGGPGSGLFRSRDGGKTFKELRNGLPKGDLGRIDLAIAPSRPGRLYAIVEAHKDDTGLYRSDDLGESWEKVNNTFNVKARPFYLSTVEVDPHDFNRVYNPSYQLAASQDGGKTFPSIRFGGGVHADIQAIWINPKNPSHILLGTDGGLYISHDKADTFMMVPNLPVSQFYHVTVDDAQPFRVYGGLQDNGSWYAPSSSPGGINNHDWTNVGGGDGFCVARDRKFDNYVYWESQGGNLNRLDEETGEVKNIIPYPEKGMEKNRFNWNSPFVRSPINPETIYYGSQYLYRSSDQGDTWVRISPDLTTDDPEKQRQEESGGLTPDATSAENHCTIFTIAESPLDDQVVWAGTDDGNLQVTQDGGKTWRNTTPNIQGLPANTWCSSVSPSTHEKSWVYATFDGHRSGDKKPYVYLSKDFGASWQNLASDDITAHCHVIRQDLKNPDLLYLGAETGLYISLDNGAQWIHFNKALPLVSVRDMVFHPEENDLVLATHGRGIYVMDDLTPIQALTSEVLSENLALLPTRPAQALPASGGGGVSQGSNYYSASNPNEGVTITYFMKKRHLFGDFYIEILDADGNLVKKLTAGKRVGINRVYWAMRLKPPKVARAQSFAGGFMMGPKAREGVYTVRLAKGRDTYETTVAVAPHAANKHSEEDRRLQEETVWTLYRLQENVAFLADQVTGLQKQLDGHAKTLEKGALFGKLKKRSEALGEFHKTIVSDSESIFVDKPRLREDAVELYSRVSSYLGRPTQNQLDQTLVIQERFEAANREAESLFAVEDLNKALNRKKLEPITILDREAWDENQEKEESDSYNPRLVKKWGGYWDLAARAF